MTKSHGILRYFYITCIFYVYPKYLCTLSVSFRRDSNALLCWNRIAAYLYQRSTTREGAIARRGKYRKAVTREVKAAGSRRLASWAHGPAQSVRGELRAGMSIAVHRVVVSESSRWASLKDRAYSGDNAVPRDSVCNQTIDFLVALILERICNCEW